jgi:hypothetical protein
MKHLAWMLAALTLLSGCGSAIAPDQADGHDCNFSVAKTACSPASFCDPGEPGPSTGYLRKNTYGLTRDKTDVTGVCRPKGATGAACLGVDECKSGVCTHAGAAPAIGAKGVCQ